MTVKFAEFFPVAVSDRVVKAYDSIAGLSLDHVVKRVSKESKILPEVVDIASDEYKKFLYLVAIGNQSMAMCSPDVDEIWHTHILFTQDYADFCRKAYGSYLHHMPATDERPVPKENVTAFVSAYKGVFGDLHPIWSGDALRCFLSPPLCETNPGPPCGDCGCNCKGDEDEDDDEAFWV